MSKVLPEKQCRMAFVFYGDTIIYALLEMCDNMTITENENILMYTNKVKYEQAILLIS